MYNYYVVTRFNRHKRRRWQYKLTYIIRLIEIIRGFDTLNIAQLRLSCQMSLEDYDFDCYMQLLNPSPTYA